MKNGLNKWKFIFFYIAILVAVGCGSAKKKLTTVDIERQKIEFASPEERQLIINNLCDSITGQPIQFEKKVEKAGVTSTIKTVGNNLIVTQIQKDTIVIYKDVYKDKLVEKETVKVKTSIRTILFFCLVILIFIIFPGIPKAINNLALKLIRGF